MPERLRRLGRRTAACATRRATAYAYSLTPTADAFRPPQPTDGKPLPVLVTPDVAAAPAAGRILPLAIEGQPVTGRIVGIIRRFPSIVGGAVVADRQTAETLLDTARRGSARPTSSGPTRCRRRRPRR